MTILSRPPLLQAGRPPIPFGRSRCGLVRNKAHVVSGASTEYLQYWLQMACNGESLLHLVRPPIQNLRWSRCAQALMRARKIGEKSGRVWDKFCHVPDLTLYSWLWPMASRKYLIPSFALSSTHARHANPWTRLEIANSRCAL